MLVEETTVSEAALPVAKFKDHLRMGSGFADDTMQDDMLEGYLRAALAVIEARTGKITIERLFSVEFTKWRDVQDQPLPLAPVSQLIDISVVDPQGSEATADSSKVILVMDTHRPRLTTLGAQLPIIAHGARAKVYVVAGYGPNWTDMPSDMAQAVMLLAAHFYENRSDRSGLRQTMPFGVMSLIERFRNIRMFGGGAQ